MRQREFPLSLVIIIIILGGGSSQVEASHN